MKRTAKRIIDVFLALAALALTSPLLIFGALAVKLTSPGAVFYRAKRAGLNGRPFMMYKLRTMQTGTDSPDRRITAETDERVTPVGRWLRRFKIDELPQLWNVVRGDMAVVGPRPEDWHIVQEHYLPQWRRAFEVRPGIASLLDVCWFPDLTYHDPPPPGVSIQDHYLKRHLPMQAKEAIRYVERQSFWLDLQVVARLLYCVVVRSWLPPARRPLPSNKVNEDQTCQFA